MNFLKTPSEIDLMSLEQLEMYIIQCNDVMQRQNYAKQRAHAFRLRARGKIELANMADKFVAEKRRMLT